MKVLISNVLMENRRVGDLLALVREKESDVGTDPLPLRRPQRQLGLGALRRGGFQRHRRDRTHRQPSRRHAAPEPPSYMNTRQHRRHTRLRLLAHPTVAQDLYLGLEQPQLRVVARHEKLGKENDQEGDRRIHLARLHHGALKKCRHFSVMGLAYILAPRSGRAKSAGARLRPRKNLNLGYYCAFARVSLPVATEPNGDSNHQSHQ